jgi:alanine dehydrogenase
LTPSEVKELVLNQHEIFVQSDAGKNAGYTNDAYIIAGATILIDTQEIYDTVDFITKVKEIEESEYPMLREGQIIFTCLHPASNVEEVDALIERKVIAFTAEDAHQYGSPNCEAAGKLGALMGAYHLLSINGGRGQTLFGLGGAPSGRVLILGAGIAGKGATEIISALGAQTYLLDINIQILREAQYSFSKNVTTMISNRTNIQSLLPEIDLVINCVKWPKHRTDHLIYKEDLHLMKKGTVIVDVSADVGGAIETYQHTTHENPTYVVNGVIHYGVDNIPGAAAHSTSIAYAASIFPHILSIANKGIKEACINNGYLRRSMCVYKGQNTHEETSIIQGRDFVSPEEVLGITEESLHMAPHATSTKIT